MAQATLFTELDTTGFETLINGHLVQAWNDNDGTPHAMTCRHRPPGRLYGDQVAASTVQTNGCVSCRRSLLRALRLPQLRPILSAVDYLPRPEHTVLQLVHRRIGVQFSPFVATPLARALINAIDAALERVGSSLTQARAAEVDNLTAIESDMPVPPAPGPPVLVAFSRELGDSALRGASRRVVGLHMLPDRRDVALMPAAAAQSLLSLYGGYFRPHDPAVVPCESIDLALTATTLHRQGGVFDDLNVAVAAAREALR